MTRNSQAFAAAEQVDAVRVAEFHVDGFDIGLREILEGLRNEQDDVGGRVARDARALALVATVSSTGRPSAAPCSCSMASFSDTRSQSTDMSKPGSHCGR